MKEYGREYFEKREHTPINLNDASLYLGTIAHLIKDTLNPETFLDIGCARGFFIFLMKELGIEGYGLDISEFAISSAPPEVKERLHVLDVRRDRFPFPDKSFDLITILEVLEHLDSHTNIMEEAIRCLKDRGYILATIALQHDYERDETHCVPLKKPYYIDLFRHYELEVADRELNEMRRVFREKREFHIKRFHKIYATFPAVKSFSKFILRKGGIVARRFRQSFSSKRYYGQFERNFFERAILVKREGCGS